MKTKLRYASLTAGAIALAVTLLWLPASPQGSGYNSYQNTIFSTATPATGIRQNTTILYHKIAWTPTGSPAACTVAIDSSVDGTNWSAGGILTGQTCTTAGVSAVTAGQANYVRVNVTALTASKTVTIVYEGWAYNPSGAAAGVTSITATAPITVTPSPLVATGVAACPTCAIGPGTSVANHLASFSGTDGVTLADSGALAPAAPLTTAGVMFPVWPAKAIITEPSLVLTTNEMDCLRWVPNYSVTATRITYNPTISAGTSSHVGIAIYNSTGATRIATTGALDGTLITTQTVVVASFTVQAGVDYVVCWTDDAATATTWSVYADEATGATMGNLIAPPSGVATLLKGTTASTAGAPPASLSTLIPRTTGSGIPFIFISP